MIVTIMCSGQRHTSRVIEPVRMIIWKDKKKGIKVFKVLLLFCLLHVYISHQIYALYNVHACVIWPDLAWHVLVYF